MNFLEARRVLERFSGGSPAAMLMATSGTADPLVIYLRAEAATLGLDLTVRLLPFNTLGQTLRTPPNDGEPEVFLLFPWDLDPALDWRSGVPKGRLDLAELLETAAATLRDLCRRPAASLLYVPAPIPPVGADGRSGTVLSARFTAMALEAGAELIDAEAFSLSSYFASGLPIGGQWLGSVAARAVAKLSRRAAEPGKLLITDLDNTLWRGVLAEDGVEGVQWSAEGVGFRHFVYQTLLRRLRGEGVLLAAVSRNSPEVVRPLLQAGRMPLGDTDFVAVVASYHAKSGQIREVARQLNLGLEAVTFVDDNPVELEEVARSLPAVQCLRFPDQDGGLPPLLDALVARFGRLTVTDEDRQRTELYRRRLESLVPAETEGANLEEFLRDLRMKLTVHDRSSGDRARAVQLINKTNQFNANGRRVTDDEVARILGQGGRLLTATLEDRTGSHGEILACLVSADGTVTSLVLSCRVFQRRVEHAFCAWLASQPNPPTRFEFAVTDRNEPFRIFLEDPAFRIGDGEVGWDAQRFARSHSKAITLFDLVGPLSVAAR
jgi:FkbH-like protein